VLGLCAGLLGLGAFHPNAPWTLLHRAPVFSDLHVPSRFFIVMVLLLTTAFVAWVAVPVDRLLLRFPWLDLILLLPVATLVFDLSSESQRCVRQSFWLEGPSVINPAAVFEHHKSSAVAYERGDEEQPPSLLLPMFANQGILDGTGLPDDYSIGALAVEDPNYRGMVEVDSSLGHAQIIEWSPNRAVVRVENAKEGGLLIYNMNYDPSWRANGASALNHRSRVAMRLRAGDSTVVFNYWPRRLTLGLCLCLATLGAIALWLRRRRVQASY